MSPALQVDSLLSEPAGKPQLLPDLPVTPFRTDRLLLRGRSSLHKIRCVHINLYYSEQNQFCWQRSVFLGIFKFSLNWKAVFMSTNYTFNSSTNLAKFVTSGCFHQIVDKNMEVIIKLDELDRWCGFYLMNDHASPFRAIFFGLFHLFAYWTVCNFSQFPFCWR